MDDATTMVRRVSHNVEPMGGERSGWPRWSGAMARAKLRCEMRARLARPLLGTDALTWRNTNRAVLLFVRATLRDRVLGAERPGSEEARFLSSMFALGAVEEAGDLVHLSRFGRHRIACRILSDPNGLRRTRPRRLLRDLERWSFTPTGRRAVEAGRAALIDWFEGEDPSSRLSALLEPTPSDPVERSRPQRLVSV